MEITTLPEQIKNWLIDRGITEGTILDHSIGWDGRIVIPVLDREGKRLFSKYRRSPLSDEGPKYQYDKGASSTLYNFGKSWVSPLFIVEGELDCLLLLSRGQNAVSTTGGSGTFLEEWADEINEKFSEVYVCYDNDDSGLKGAIRVQALIPKAKMVFIPQEEGVKDVTDYLKKHTFQEFSKLVAGAKSYLIPKDIDEMPKKKSHFKKVVDGFRDAANALLVEKQKAITTRGSNVKPVLFMLEYVNRRHEHYSKTLKSWGKSFEGSNNDLEAAKKVPMATFVKFSFDGYAKCIFHNEKSGSMKYNDFTSKFPNTVKCYGCGAMGDTVDVVMKINNCDMKQAIKIILNK